MINQCFDLCTNAYIRLKELTRIENNNSFLIYRQSIISMLPWLSHLLEDIAAPHRKESSEPEAGKSFDVEMEEIEQWVTGDEPKETFSDYCGLKSESFPPPDQLTNGEMKKVCRAFRKMMASWNLGDGFPDLLPISLTYKFLVETLNKGTSIPSSGFMIFDYCNGDAPECVFKEYSTCLQFWKDKPEDKNMTKL